MKCIRCNHDSKYTERTNRVCPQCRKFFAFEPREGDPVSDMLFKNAIDAVSGLKQVRFGAENLYYEVCRRKRKKSLPVGCSVALFAIAIILAFAGGMDATRRGLLIGAVAAALVGLINLGIRATARYAPISPSQFRGLYERWCKVHDTPWGVIQRREQPAPPPEAEPDLCDYSFDRAVICDRARTVDLLLANNFHFENNCAILSADGYPPGPFAAVKEMLKRNPKLQVFVLHDATPQGCRLAHRLAHDRNWFPQPVRIIDAGLRPVHARQFVGLLQHAESGAVHPGEGLSAAEAKWLAENSLELAAIRPQRVIRWLFRAINSQTRPKASETELADTSSGGDGDVFFYLGGDERPFARESEAVDADFDSFG
jgi:hypothetical protein